MKRDAKPRLQYGPKSNTVENKMVDLIDQLNEFEEFQKKIYPMLQKDLKAGMSAKDLRAKYAPMAQARIIMEALSNPDGGKAVVAASDLLNRNEGKATEKKEVKHVLENLSDKELDAVLESELQDLDDMNERFDS